MKCKHCKASVEESRAESYEIDWYCACGIEDNDRTENSKGELGCNLHYRVVNKRTDRFNRDNNEMMTDEYLRSGY